MEEGDGLRTRSFRYEDYETRRVFLRSYPLHFDNNEGDQETQAPTTTRGDRVNIGTSDTDTDSDTHEFDHGKEHKKDKKMKTKKEEMKKIVVTILKWGGGRVVVLRRFKHKISFYIVACLPIAFKPPKAITSSS